MTGETYRLSPGHLRAQGQWDTLAWSPLPHSLGSVTEPRGVPMTSPAHRGGLAGEPPPLATCPGSCPGAVAIPCHQIVPHPQPVPSTRKPELQLHQPDPSCAQPPSWSSLRWDVLQETITQHHRHPWPRCHGERSKGLVTVPPLGWGQRASPRGATVIP